MSEAPSHRWIQYLPTQLSNWVNSHPELAKGLDNFSWLIYERVLRLAIGLIASIFVARHLGPDGFGLLSYAVSFVGLFAGLSMLGLNSVAVRDASQNPEAESEILSAAFYLQLCSRSLVVVLSLWTMTFIGANNHITVSLVGIFSLAQLFQVSDVFRYGFEARVASRHIVKPESVVVVISGLLKICLAVWGARIESFAFIALLEATILFWVLWRLGQFKLSVTPLISRAVLARARKLLETSWPMIISGTALVIFLKVDMVMLGSMASASETGIYSAAVRLSEFWYVLPIAFVGTIFPALAKGRLNAERHEIYKRKILAAFCILACTALLISLATNLVADPLVLLIYGESFAPAADVLIVHIWAGVFVFIGVLGGRWYLLEGLQKLGIVRNALAALVNVTLNWIAIPKYGAIGAAYATLISYACATYLFDLLSIKTRPMFVTKSKALLIVPALLDLAKPSSEHRPQ